MSRLGLLGRNCDYRRLWASRTISLLGDFAAMVALVLFVIRTEGSGTAVGLLLLVRAVTGLLGPLAGAVVDRTDQRGLMLGCELGQAALVAAIALLLPPFPVVLALFAGVSVLSALFQPAGRSVLPALVSDEDLPSANALRGIGANIGYVAGPALGGFLVAGFGIRAALLLDVLTFLLSAALLSRLPALPPALAATGTRSGVFHDTWTGLRYVSRHPTARAVTLGLFLVVAFAGLDNVAAGFLAEEVFGMGALGLGLLSSSYGAGMVLAPLALLRWGGRLDPASVLLLGIGLMGVGTLLTGLAPIFLFAVAVQGTAGVGNGLENVANDVLIQRTVPRPMMGRVFGAVYSGASVGENIAYAAGGRLLDLTSARAVYVIAGSGALVALLLVWVLLRRMHRTIPDARVAPTDT